MKRMIAVYRDPSRACRATSELEARGVARKHISLLTSTSASGQLFLSRYQTSHQNPAADPITIGNTGTMLASSLAASGAMFVGPIGAALHGSKVAGLRNALIALGIPTSDATLRSTDIGDGAVLVSVDSQEETREAQIIEETLKNADRIYMPSCEPGPPTEPPASDR